MPHPPPSHPTNKGAPSTANRSPTSPARHSIRLGRREPLRPLVPKFRWRTDRLSISINPMKSGGASSGRPSASAAAYKVSKAIDRVGHWEKLPSTDTLHRWPYVPKFGQQLHSGRWQKSASSVRPVLVTGPRYDFAILLAVGHRCRPLRNCSPAVCVSITERRLSARAKHAATVDLNNILGPREPSSQGPATLTQISQNCFTRARPVAIKRPYSFET